MKRTKLVRILITACAAALGVAAVPAVAGAGPSAVTLTVKPAKAQYSDAVLLKATVKPARLAGRITFAIDGATEGLVGKPCYTAKNGSAYQLYRVPLPKGEYSIEATFTGAGPSRVASAVGSLTVRPEDARATFWSCDGIPLPWLRPINSAETSTTAPFAFGWTYVEVPDGTPGDLDQGIQRQYQLSTIGPLGSPSSPSAAGRVAGGARSAAGAARSERYEFPEGARTGTYMYQVSSPGYYTAHAEYAFVVYDPALGMSAGAGSFINPTSHNPSAVAFLAIPLPDDGTDGIFAFQEADAEGERQWQMNGLGDFSAVPPNGAQVVAGPVVAALTQKIPSVPGSASTVAMVWAPPVDPDDHVPADFGPTRLTRGAIDLVWLR